MSIALSVTGGGSPAFFAVVFVLCVLLLAFGAWQLKRGRW